MKRWLCTFLAAAFVLLLAAPARAQQTKPDEPVAVFGVAGVLDQQVERAGQLGTTGPTVGFQYRSAHQGPAGFVVEISVQPAPAQDRHPTISDSLAPFYLMSGVEVGRHRYVRVSVGFTSVATVAPIAGVAIGLESSGRGVITGLEFVTRVAGTAKSFGIMAGFQARVGGHPNPR